MPCPSPVDPDSVTCDELMALLKHVATGRDRYAKHKQAFKDTPYLMDGMRKSLKELDSVIRPNWDKPTESYNRLLPVARKIDDLFEQASSPEVFRLT